MGEEEKACFSRVSFVCMECICESHQGEGDLECHRAACGIKAYPELPMFSPFVSIDPSVGVRGACRSWEKSE